MFFSSFSSFLALSLILSSPVAAFTFTPGTPSECDNFPISWTGGTPPFQLLLTPVFGVPQNISIPLTAFNNGAGSFSMQLQIPATTQLILTMSDATGFNSGGTTAVLTVGASVGGSSCNTTSPTIPFSFELNDALTQCIPFDFTGFTGAVQPVTIAAFIPGGTAFELNPPAGSTSFSWIANVIHGTSMIFSMTDAQGRPGGSSDIRTVGLSDDSSCLNNLSPSSTLVVPSPTTSTSASPTAAHSHSISNAAAAGTVIAVLFLAVIITLGLFFLRKRLDSQTPSNSRRFRRSLESEIDLSFNPRQVPVVTPYNAPQNYNPVLAPHPYCSNVNPSFDANPFDGAPPQPVTHHQMSSQDQLSGSFQSPSQYYPLLHGYPPENPVSDSAPSSSRIEFESFPGQSTSGDSTSTSQRKAAIAGVTANRPARFVLHTDADDMPQSNDEEVVELPPQYSERQRMTGLADFTPDSNAGHLPGGFS